MLIEVISGNQGRLQVILYCFLISFLFSKISVSNNTFVTRKDVMSIEWKKSNKAFNSASPLAILINNFRNVKLILKH